MPGCPSCGQENPEGARFCNACAAPLEAVPAAREQRKTVTVLFCDVTGSTALGESTDPEALRALLARYFERMKAIVEAHGGTVEKFIGDAVMAVFGVPQVHEDDALRACGAAVEMRDALPELGVQARIGLNTGEVVTGTEERLATGDAVNVAARLEQAAQPGEILIGADTLALVRDAVESEPVEPLELKGKAEVVAPHRLLDVTGELERRDAAPMVGRETELLRLREAYDAAVAQRSCVLFTVVGEPGVGKSRLVREFAEHLDAVVVRGRCPPYGDGITYWPVVEVLRQIDTRPADESAEAAIASLLGERPDPAPADAIAWAVRKTFEAAARERRLVCVFDDIQWGEATFLDLVEQVALLSSDAPILLVCMARPELLDVRPAWPVDLRLEPLASDEVELLLPDEMDESLRSWIGEAAGGNPLFVLQMVAAARESDEKLVVPATLKALLAARLDQLGEEERRVLETASVEGEVFHLGALRSLAEVSDLTPCLMSLARRQLVDPARARIAGEDAFSFHHLLIRDVAYESVTKRRRAELHERLARWLDRHGLEVVELDELVGYHLEQACTYRTELGAPADAALADMARRRLSSAGYRALRRQDYAAGAALLERGASVLPADGFDLVLEVELRDALYQLGKSDEAMRRAEALAERAAASGNEIARRAGNISAEVMRSILEPTGARARLLAVVQAALPDFEAAQDDAALYLAYDALGWLPGATWGETLDVTEKSAAHARRVGHEPTGYDALGAAARFLGPTPAAEVLAWLDERGPATATDHVVSGYRAGALGMLGRFDEARAILAALRAQLTEQGPSVLLANITAFESVWVELWAGNARGAVEFAAAAADVAAEVGEYTFAAAATGTRARALYALGSYDEAERWADHAAELAGLGEEIGHSALWRHVKAKLLARRGEHAEAERLAREAIELLERTDYLNNRGDALLDLAEVLALGGRFDEVAPAARQAATFYDQKGNIPSKAAAAAMLAGLKARV